MGGNDRIHKQDNLKFRLGKAQSFGFPAYWEAVSEQSPAVSGLTPRAQ